jgi:hypothetical protein
MVPTVFLLKGQPDAEFHHPSRRRFGDLSEPAGRIARAVESHRRVQVRERDGVEGVERFRADVQLHASHDAEHLGDAEVDAIEARADQDVASAVAEQGEAGDSHRPRPLWGDRRHG